MEATSSLLKTIDAGRCRYGSRVIGLPEGRSGFFKNKKGPFEKSIQSRSHRSILVSIVGPLLLQTLKYIPYRIPSVQVYTLRAMVTTPYRGTIQGLYDETATGLFLRSFGDGS